MKKILFVFFVTLICFSNINAVQYWGEGVFADFGFSSKTFVPKPLPLEGSIGFRKEFEEINFFQEFVLITFLLTFQLRVQ